MADDTYWNDIADECAEAGLIATKRTWKEATMQDDSWNQQACEGVADGMTAAVGIGSYVNDYTFQYGEGE